MDNPLFEAGFSLLIRRREILVMHTSLFLANLSNDYTIFWGFWVLTRYLYRCILPSVRVKLRSELNILTGLLGGLKQLIG